jgi:DUF4097 and DUF4098 domain-containing protein YvlB
MTPVPTRISIASRSTAVIVVASDGTELSVEGGLLSSLPDGTFAVAPGHGVKVIHVHGPAHLAVTVGTSSGTVEMSGPLGRVAIVSRSGRIHVAEAQELDVRTTSAVIEVGTCSGDCHVVSTSGKVKLGQVGEAHVSSVSGSVTVGLAGTAEVRTISGNVSIGMAGTGGHITVRTVSGKVEGVVSTVARLPSR